MGTGADILGHPVYTYKWNHQIKKKKRRETKQNKRRVIMNNVTETHTLE